MRVFSKKNLEFTNPDTQQKVRLQPMEFGNVPEWVEKDPLFSWAKAEGSLEIFGEDKPVKTTGKPSKTTKAEPEETTPEGILQ